MVYHIHNYSLYHLVPYHVNINALASILIRFHVFQFCLILSCASSFGKPNRELINSHINNIIYHIYVCMYSVGRSLSLSQESPRLFFTRSYRYTRMHFNYKLAGCKGTSATQADFVTNDNYRRGSLLSARICMYVVYDIQTYV